MTVIHGKTLSTFEVAPDGRTVSIHVADENDQRGSLILPTDCLGSLTMTLTEMMRQALMRRHRDASLRYVYPVADWCIEASGERPEFVILTLGTPDGFRMSFALSRTDLRRMTEGGLDREAEILRH